MQKEMPKVTKIEEFVPAWNSFENFSEGRKTCYSLLLLRAGENTVLVTTHALATTSYPTLENEGKVARVYGSRRLYHELPLLEAE